MNTTTLGEPNKNQNGNKWFVFRWVLVFFLMTVGVIWSIYTIDWLKNKNQQINDLQRDNAQLALKLKNIEVMMDSSGLFITLQKELIMASNGKLGVWLPDVTKKILELSERYKDDKLSVATILALVEIESNFDPKATSTAVVNGVQINVAYGLTQVVRSTAIHYLNQLNYPWSQEVLYDPVLSLEVGARYLIDTHRQNISEKLEKSEDWNWTILMYYHGERSVKDSLRLPLGSKDGISLQYWDRFNKAQRRWEEKGF